MRITSHLLREKGACGPDIKKFLERWPSGCEVTPENCKIAFGELGMNADWAAEFLLPPLAWATYLEAMGKSWEKFLDIAALAYKKYSTSDNPWAECHATLDVARAEDQKTCIAAFCKLAQQST